MTLLWNDGNGALVEGNSYANGQSPDGLRVADLNNDAYPDLLQLPYVPNCSAEIQILINNGDRTLAGLETNRLGYTEHQSEPAIADFDGDGDLDAAGADELDASIIVRFNDGAGRFREKATYAVPIEPSNVIAGDFDGDQDSDLVAIQSDAGLAVVLSNGGRSFTASDAIMTATSAYLPRAADLNGDGVAEVLLYSARDGADAILVFKLEGGVLSLTSTIEASDSYGSYLVDLLPIDGDADGDLDLATATSAYWTGELHIHENDGAGRFGEPRAVSAMPFGDYPIRLASGDFNGDGVNDLAVNAQDIRLFFWPFSFIPVLPSNSSVVHILENEGDGDFHLAQSEPFFDARAIIASDVDKDADIDLALTTNDGSFSPQRLTVLPNHDGRFGLARDGGMPATAPQLADFDGDGDPDLLDDASQTFVFIANDGNGMFTPPSIATIPIPEDPEACYYETAIFPCGIGLLGPSLLALGACLIARSKPRLRPA